MSSTFRQRILKSYLHDEELYEVIGHTRLYYVTIITTYILLMIIIMGTYILLIGFVPSWQFTTILQTTLWVGVIAIYCSAVLKILDAYLDGLLITNMSLVLFQRDGLFRQKAINLQRVSIETIVFEQNSLRDTIFHKGTLSIFVEDQKYIFYDVANPRLAVATITNRKEKILWRVHYSENEVEPVEFNKYEMLVEALWEVVSEYVQKKNWNPL